MGSSTCGTARGRAPNLARTVLTFWAAKFAYFRWRDRVAAVQDGRLEEGARYAAKALEDSSVSESRKPFVKSYATLTRLALAVAYLGTGEYVKAEAALKQVEAFFDLKDRTPEEQAIMEQMIQSKPDGVQALVLVPTRELALQVGAQYDMLRGKKLPAADRDALCPAIPPC